MISRASRFLLALLTAAAVAACSDKDGSQLPAPGIASPGAGAPAVSPTPANGAGSPTATVPVTNGKTVAGGPAEFEGSRAMEHIKELSQTIGPRVAGSPEAKSAAEYIANQLRAFGYDTQVTDFTYTGDRFRAGSVSTGTQSFASYTMTGSTGGNVRGPGVFVGVADPAGIAGRSLQGMVAIADRGGIPFSEKAANVKAAGAVGLVVANNEEGDFIGNVGNTDLTVVSVDDEAGAVLRNAAQQGAEVIIASGSERTTAQNVLARATPGGACRLLVGGHYDTVPAAPGALDNASGTATVLELARAMAADGLDDGLCFAAFSAEESGLFGSQAMADALAAQSALPKAMVNLDMTALGDSVDLIGSPDLTQRADAIAERLGIAAEPTTLGENFGSDHQSFEKVGAPVLFLTTSELGQFHTPGDTLATLDPEDLERCGDLAYAVITELAAQVARG
ncbi:MAG: M20/M25/M40 family metallo-hydrolase [Hyphomicrobiales bacterium]